MSASPERVPILTYHSLDDTGSVISMAPAVFARQMRSLRERGFRGIALGELLDAWEGKSSLPERAVVLTFDDAFKNLLEVGLPVLGENGFRATVFAVAGYCGRANDWPTQPKSIPRLPLLSASELLALSRAGVEVGAHGVTHAPLDRLAPKDAEEEIVGSRRMLEEALGLPVTVFAYPYGLASHSARETVRAHYRGAVSVEMGTARSGSDRCWLERVDMYYFRDERLAGLFGTPLGACYLALRAAGRKLKRLLG